MINIPELLHDLDITYRQFDYWLRHGWIRIEGDVVGSGQRRQMTEVEAEALRSFVFTVREIEKVQNMFKSGEMWAEIVNNKRSAQMSDREKAILLKFSWD